MTLAHGHFTWTELSEAEVTFRRKQRLLRNISVKAAEIFQFSGRIAPSDKAYAWAALSENGGKAINFTADGVLYSGYILSEIEMDFQPDRMIGSLMIKLRGAE